jgi:type IV pilus assembly protein PilC
VGTLSLSALIELCRVQKHYLSAGLTITEVFKQQAERGAWEIRPIASKVVESLKGGSSLGDALAPFADAFPPLYLSLTTVGEQTGMLPEVYGELERYYEQQAQLRRDFLGQIAWPVFQFCAAVFVLAGLIYFLGQLPINTMGKGKYDPLGLGLLGASGAIIFLGTVVGVLAAAWMTYVLLRWSLAGRASVDRFILGLPGIGPCALALAMSRFCLALRLTTESGMSISKALRLSMRATGNAAFENAVPTATSTVKAGDDVTLALKNTGLFPPDFLRIVEVAEESGTISEVMKQQAGHYNEEATRHLKFLTGVAGYAVWVFVAACIIFAIFRLYSTYLSGLSGEGLPF